MAERNWLSAYRSPRFTNGVAGGGDDGQDRKAKAKMSKIEKLFERPADASEAPDLQSMRL